ncbi:hypothetical protein CPSG_07272 [Coccidioides posadasii str. Silveira]|uniref:Uncharacterized protein n=1 Tax=Coccidioides posadasii (strain RMSCC 757 / Silveira) TaxID=443226 RepID=E9DBS0_COCPS|nr:hypothetical protein CPSG_07272 [Coccidioides posadasii str. Silveira]
MLFGISTSELHHANRASIPPDLQLLSHTAMHPNGSACPAIVHKSHPSDTAYKRLKSLKIGLEETKHW